MATLRIIFGKGYNEYGAFSGYPDIDKCDLSGARIYDRAVPLNSGGYDSTGRYWGIGAPLRVSYAKNLSFVHFYRATWKDGKWVEI